MPFRFLHATLFALHMHWHRWWREDVVILAFFLLALLGGYFFFLAPPSDFARNTTITVASGSSLGAVAAELKNDHLIKSQTAFALFVRVTGGADRIHAGRYRFVAPQNAFVIAARLESGESGIPPVRITFPEGTTNAEMAVLIHTNLGDITERDFIAASASYQGYLFPDTYIFSAGDTLGTIIDRLRANFDTRIAPIKPALQASGHSLGDIVTMASILEAETNTPRDRSIVAGILWHRIALGMALQVDAAPDTYKNTGLPPRPINNPGLEAISAALTPAKTAYLFYLTGTDGNMHYAKTFAEHQANLTKYLK